MCEVLGSSVPNHGQLTLEWMGEDQPEQVTLKILLEGSKGPKWHHIHYPSESGFITITSPQQHACTKDVYDIPAL